MLTGHHENCPRRPDPLGKALDLIAKLAHGMECWAADEDGIHPDAWEAYRQAKALEGVFLAPNVSRQQSLPADDWIETETSLPEDGEWVLHTYAGVRPPEYGLYNLGRFWRDAGPESLPATHWLPVPCIALPNVKEEARRK